MSTIPPSPATRSRWMDWQPQGQVLVDSPSREPAKPSKPSSGGFDGSAPGESAIIPAVSDHAQPVHERGILWTEWKAGALNRLFEKQGTSGQPGRITAATVRHGETKPGKTEVEE